MKKVLFYLLFFSVNIAFGQPPGGGVTAPAEVPYTSLSLQEAYPVSLFDDNPCDGYYVIIDTWEEEDPALEFDFSGLPELEVGQFTNVIFQVSFYNKTAQNTTLLQRTDELELRADDRNLRPNVLVPLNDIEIGESGLNYVEFNILSWEHNGLEDSQLEQLKFVAKMQKRARYRYQFVPCFYTNQVVAGQNPVTFTWENCCEAPNYEFQLLRLFNIDENPINNEFDTKAVIDWSTALDLETGNSQKHLTLTVAEGTGWYVWRVRPIFDYHKNTVGDDRNWGVWTEHGPYIDNASLFPKNNLGSYVFFYDQFDNDKNWIYSRNFVEGEPNHGSQLRIGEGITYANGLLMGRQSQAKNQSQNEVLGSQTIIDYNGRPSLQSLSAPLGKNYFTYEYNLLKNSSNGLYQTSDMDGDLKYKNPSEVGLQSKINSYYSNSNSDLSIPNAENRPYAQSIFYTDGLGRLKAQAGAGKTFDLHDGGRVTKYYYAKATDKELLKVFGDEAPPAPSVDKIITLDANGVGSIAYKDENERIIATCLSVNPNNTLLDPLETEIHNSNSAIVVDDDIIDPNNVNTIDNGKTLYSSAVYNFLVPTTLELHYTLNRKKYGEGCMNLCASCDYQVEITITSAEDPNYITTYNTRKFTFTPTTTPPSPPNLSGPSICTSSMDDGQHLWDGYGSSANILSLVDATPGGGTPPPLEPGTYTVTRKLKLYNKNDLNQEFLTQNIQTIKEALYNKIFTTGTFAVINIVGANQSASMSDVMTYLDNNDIHGLYTYLNVNPTAPGVSPAVMVWEFLSGCVKLNIPIFPCPAPDCSAPNYFTDKFINEINGNPDLVPMSNYVTPPSANPSLLVSYSIPKQVALTGAPIHSWYPSGSLTFDGMIQTYMLNDGYTCEEVDFAWTQVIGRYKSLVDAVVPAAWPDLLHEFILNTFQGYKIDGYRTPTGTNLHPDVINKPYKYFSYTYDDCQQCQTAFYCKTNTNPATITNNSQFDTWFTGLSPENKNSFYLCVYNSCNNNASQVTITNTLNQIYSNFPPGILDDEDPTSPNGNGAGINDVTQMESYLENLCISHCENSWQSFFNQIKAEYEELGYAVEGYICPACTSATEIPIEEVYCKANAMVEKCKEGCQLTVFTGGAGPCAIQVIGTPAEISNYQNSMMGMVDIELPNPLNSNNCTVGFNYCQLPVGSNTSSLEALVQNLNSHANTVKSNIQNQIYPSPYNWDISSIVNSFPQGAGGSPTPYANLNINGITSACDLKFTIGEHLELAGPIVSSNPSFNLNVTHIYNNQMSQNMSLKIRVKVSVQSILAPGQNIKVTDVLPANCVLVNNTINSFTYYNNSAQNATPTFIFDYEIKSVGGTNIDIGQMLIEPSWGIAVPHTFILPDIIVTNCPQVYYSLVCPPEGGITAPIFAFCDKELGCDGICYKYGLPEDVHNYDLSIYTCEQTASDAMISAISNEVSAALQKQEDDIRLSYESNCLKPTDIFKSHFALNYYNYTLYYYDRAGNLVRTVPPSGVHYLLPPDDTRLNHPEHTLATEYEYNSIKQLLRQKTPDGNETHFWYDNKGRLRFSQNEKQLAANKFSYTKYDNLSRIIEVGESVGLGSNEFYIGIQAEDVSFPTSQCKDITYTKYDELAPSLGILTDQPLQRFTENRIGYTISDPDGLANSGDENFTVYSYDPHGNVEWLEQRISTGLNNEIVAKRIYYTYDLASGAVLEVDYNPSYFVFNPLATPVVNDDQFLHKYIYDSDKRLLQVKTKVDNGPKAGLFSIDATYEYYKHGPLKRTTIGNNKLQGIDYTYTLQGWLKSINHSSLDPTKDPGLDNGYNGRASDIWGMELQYFQNDFNRSYGTTQSPFNANTSNPYFISTDPLYNGNISAWTSNISYASLPNATVATLAYPMLTGNKYRYDELNRIKKSHFTWFDAAGSGGWNINSTNQFNEYFRYDLNGNIKHLLRNGNTGTNGNSFFATASTAFPGIFSNMDDLNYNYYSNTNKLKNVQDDYTTAGNINIDLKPGQVTNNYQYDEIGNLVTDDKEFLGVSGSSQGIEWNVYGKVSKIIKLGGSPLTETFSYDATGNRVAKLKEIQLNNTYKNKGDIYIRDASGNIMAIYNLLAMSGTNGTKTTVKERPIYGSDRIGMFVDNNTNYTGDLSLSAGRQYELKDHLGNVRVVIDDDKIILPQLNIVPQSGLMACTTVGSATVTLGNPSGYILAAPNNGVVSGTPSVCTHMLVYPITNVNLGHVYNVSFKISTGNSFISTWQFNVVDGTGNTISGSSINVGPSPNSISFSFTANTPNAEIRIFHFPVPGQPPLADVNALVTDFKIQVSGYAAKILHAYNNYAFGSPEPNRNYSAPGIDYRFGFNGQEKVNEIAGIGNHNTAQFGEMDTRLGRRWNRDPKSVTGVSEYSVFMNNPIMFNDVLLDSPGKFTLLNVSFYPKSADKKASSDAVGADKNPKDGQDDCLVKFISSNKSANESSDRIASYGISSFNEIGGILKSLQAQGYIIGNIILNQHADVDGDLWLGGLSNIYSSEFASSMKANFKDYVSDYTRIIFNGCNIGAGLYPEKAKTTWENISSSIGCPIFLSMSFGSCTPFNGKQLSTILANAEYKKGGGHGTYPIATILYEGCYLGVNLPILTKRNSNEICLDTRVVANLALDQNGNFVNTKVGNNPEKQQAANAKKLKETRGKK